MPDMTTKMEAQRLKKGGVAYWRLPGFVDGKKLQHAFSTRVGGVSRGRNGTLNLSFKTGDDPLRVRENRDLFARAVGIGAERFVMAEQVHGDGVLEASMKDKGRCRGPGETLGRGDALVTKERGLALTILVADCLPVLFYDAQGPAIGIAHAGWRGTVAHTPVKTLLKMGELYGTKPSEVKVAFGPCIGACCYEVGDEVQQEFVKVFPWADEVMSMSFSGNWMLDLPETNARQLFDIGVKPGNLFRSNLCTIRRIEDFYSHRAEAIPSSVSPSRIATSSRDATVGRAGSHKEPAKEAILSSVLRDSMSGVSTGTFDKLSTGRCAAVIMLK